MASTPSLMQHVLDQMGPGATSRAMFGEYGVYYRGRIIGLFCDDRLFLKPTRASALLGEHELGPAYPGAKLSIIVPEEAWDDAALMTQLARETADELTKGTGTKAAAAAPRKAARSADAAPKRKGLVRKPRRRG